MSLVWLFACKIVITGFHLTELTLQKLKSNPTKVPVVKCVIRPLLMMLSRQPSSPLRMRNPVHWIALNFPKCPNLDREHQWGDQHWAFLITPVYSDWGVITGQVHLHLLPSAYWWYSPLQVKHLMWKWLAWTRSTSPLQGSLHLKHWMICFPASAPGWQPFWVCSTRGEGGEGQVLGCFITQGKRKKFRSIQKSGLLQAAQWYFELMLNADTSMCIWSCLPAMMFAVLNKAWNITANLAC